MKRLFLSFGLVFLLFAAVVSVRAETDPRIGTWKLDVAKSKASNGLPTSETRTYTAEGSAIMATNEGSARNVPVKQDAS